MIQFLSAEFPRNRNVSFDAFAVAMQFLRTQHKGPNTRNSSLRIQNLKNGTLTMHYELQDFVDALGKRIKALRVDRGWTQMQMMRDFGYYLSHWQNVEAGRKMSLETLLRVANTFDISVEELVSDIKRHKGAGFGSKGYYLQNTIRKKQ